MLGPASDRDGAHPVSQEYLRKTSSSSCFSQYQMRVLTEKRRELTVLHSWTRPQVQARAHPNVLSTTVWLNNLYHVSDSSTTSPEILKDVDLNVPLAYADRFRIRHPGVQWDAHPPHIDGGGIERWEEPHFRSCFESILKGDWERHDPYDLTGRLNAKTSLYGRPNQVCRI